jgi:hypothetical protein
MRDGDALAVPDDLQCRLAKQAALACLTLSAYLLLGLTEIAERPKMGAYLPPFDSATAEQEKQRLQRAAAAVLVALWPFRRKTQTGLATDLESSLISDTCVSYPLPTKRVHGLTKPKSG